MLDGSEAVVLFFPQIQYCWASIPGLFQVIHHSNRSSLWPSGLPGVNGIVKDGRDGAPGDPGEAGEAGRPGRPGHQGSPGICDTSACQGAAVHGKSSNPKNH